MISIGTRSALVTGLNIELYTTSHVNYLSIVALAVKLLQIATLYILIR